MALDTLLLRKWIAKSTFFLKSYQIGPYCTYTGPHHQFFFPMWPVSRKELPTTALEQGAQILGTLKYPIPIF